VLVSKKIPCKESKHPDVRQGDFAQVYGNYHAGCLRLTTQDWRGLTMKANFQMAKALGTGNVVQATSQVASVDPWNLDQNYGPQSYDERFTVQPSTSLNYAPLFFEGQNGVIGRLAGGWSVSPLFVYGSGFPVEITTPIGNCGSMGECSTAYVAANKNGIIAAPLNYTGSAQKVTGSVCGTAGSGYNIFKNPDASCPVNGGIFGDPVRAPILGMDSRVGSFPLYGLKFFNLDLGITKKIKINERFNRSLYFDWVNVLNHIQPGDPVFTMYDLRTWGTPRNPATGGLHGNTGMRPFERGIRDRGPSKTKTAPSRCVAFSRQAPRDRADRLGVDLPTRERLRDSRLQSIRQIFLKARDTPACRESRSFAFATGLGIGTEVHCVANTIRWPSSQGGARQ
jgi:hypothetical protein